jgi:hypothetical protein
MISRLSNNNARKLAELAALGAKQQYLLELILDWLMVYKIRLPWTEDQLVELDRAMKRYRKAIAPFSQRAPEKPNRLRRARSKAGPL